MRFFQISILGIVALSLAQGGQVEIGASSSGGISTGGLNASDGITTTGWTEKIYSSNLFANDVITGGSLNGVGSGTGSTMPTSASGFQQFTDPNNGVVFAMDSDGNNYWGTGTSGANSITIPVGVVGVNDAYILLNDYYGVLGSLQTDTVTFNFASAGAVPVTLTNGVQLDAASDCGTLPANASPTWTGAGNCSTYAQSIGAGATTTSDTAWHASYTNATSNVTVFSGTAGSLNLNDISFNLSSVAGDATDTLTSITITDNSLGSNTSRLALSAITVNSVTSVAPEPSTVLLFVAGLGVILLSARRRKSTL
jgi:hypothetical protein